MSKLACTALVTVMSFLVLRTVVHGADDYTAFVYAGCSQPRYDPDSQYAMDVESVLTSAANAAAYATYGNYTPPSGATGVVGLYQCRSDLPTAVCGGCVRSAISKLSSLCQSAAGAAVQLRACFVRYGNDSFLGKQDTSVLFKKCGGAAAQPGDGDVIGTRDAALGGLVAAATQAYGGAYRVGGAGYMQAMSQCVGDLSAKACSDCVSAAAAQLKAGCGYATAGEVYLGKCYARFWSNAAGRGGSSSNGVSSGGYGGYGGYGYGYATHAYGAGDHGDESGKTLAIIIGLVAAVALVIVFLSFVRRASGGKS